MKRRKKKNKIYLLLLFFFFLAFLFLFGIFSPPYLNINYNLLFISFCVPGAIISMNKKLYFLIFVVTFMLVFTI